MRVIDHVQEASVLGINNTSASYLEMNVRIFFYYQSKPKSENMTVSCLKLSTHMSANLSTL